MDALSATPRSVLLLALAFALALGGAACRPGAPAAANPPGASGSSGPGSAAPVALGLVRGHVRLVGAPPAAKKLDRHSDPFCEKTPRFEESVVADAQGGLRDVLVRAAGVLPAAPAAPAPPPALLEQQACTYVPRLLGVLEGQELLVKNLDGTLHNVHVFRGTQTLLNRAQKIGSEPVGREIPGPPGMLEVKCDVHPWMQAGVYVSANPWFAVTGPDGAFELRLPVGARTVEAWHPVYGSASGSVEVPASGAAALELTFNASDARDAGGSAPADPR